MILSARFHALQPGPAVAASARANRGIEEGRPSLQLLLGSANPLWVLSDRVEYRSVALWGR